MEQGVPQIQSLDESPADSFVLEFGREIDVVCGNLADAKRLCDLLGERLYEQVIGPFPIQIVSGIAVDVGEDGIDLFLSPAVERMALGAYIAEILMVALAVRLVGCLVGIGKEDADSLVFLLGERKNRELLSVVAQKYHFPFSDIRQDGPHRFCDEGKDGFRCGFFVVLPSDLEAARDKHHGKKHGLAFHGPFDGIKLDENEVVSAFRVFEKVRVCPV